MGTELALPGRRFNSRLAIVLLAAVLSTGTPRQALPAVFENGAILNRVDGSITELATGDIDGDGHVDVVIDDASLAKIQFLRGLGDGRLAFASQVTTSANPGPLAVGDVDGDARADVIVTHPGASSLSVVLSPPGGLISQSVSLPGGAVQAQLADLDGDGSRDILVVVTTTPAQLGWLRGNVNGTFQPFAMLSSIPQGTPRQLEVADFDNDGDLDVAVLAMSGLFPTILIGMDTGSGLSALNAFSTNEPSGEGPFRINPKGSSGFPEVWLYALGPIIGPGGFRGAPRYFRAAWNGQGFTWGQAVLHTSLPVSSAFRIMELNGQAVGDFVFGTDVYCLFPLLGVWAANPTFGGPGLAAADMNEDGKADLIGRTCQAVSVALLTPVGDYMIQSGGGAGYTAPVFMNQFVPFVVGDLDEDNHLDAGIVTGDSLYLWSGSSDGSFSLPTLVPIGTRFERPLRLADIDGDGRRDLVGVTTNLGYSQLAVVPNGAGTSFGPPAITSLASLHQNLAVGDVNADGRADVLVVTLSTLRVLAGNPNATLTEIWSRDLNTVFRGFRIADLDGDGNLDLVLAPVEGGITVLLGNGDGTFDPPSSFDGPLSTGPGLGVGDLDLDGVRDVCYGTSTGLVTMKGLGGGTLGSPVAAFGSEYVLLDEFGDVDYDGRPDAIVRRFVPGCQAPIEMARGLGNGTFQSEGLYVRGFAEEVVLAPLEDATSDLFFSTSSRVASFSVLRNLTTGNPPTAVEVDFGIDRIRLGGNHLGRAVPTYIEPAGPETPADIVAGSVRLNGVVSIDPTFTPVVGDRDQDGVADLEVQFLRSDLEAILPAGDAVPVNITGLFAGGGHFLGSDVVEVRRPKIHQPHAGTTVMAGTDLVVEYEMIEGASWVALLHSMDDGVTWTLDATEQENDGTLEWRAPNTGSVAARVAVAQVESGAESEPVVIGVLAVSEVFRIDTAVAVDELPAALDLSPILPTPSRGEARISFGLPRAERVTLEVLDLAGRRVAILHEGTLEAGRHQRVWRGERASGGPASAGLYLARLRTVEGERVRRVVWIR